MKRLATLATLLVITVACDAPGGTVQVEGTTGLTSATSTPDAIARGNYTGGRVVDFLEPTQALIVRENAVSCSSPTPGGRRQVIGPLHAEGWRVERYWQCRVPG